MAELVQWLSDPDASVRFATSYVLRERGVQAKEAVPALMKVLGEDSDPEVRRMAASTLGELGLTAKEAIPALEKATKDANMRVRDQAIAALRKIRL